MGKEKIYTIPVTDAYTEATDCPICYMYELLERHKIDFLLDTAYMEDDIRTATNDQGFCEKHFVMINAETNRLGIALILETHMKTLHKKITKQMKSAPQIKGLFQKNKQDEASLSAFVQHEMETCYICDAVSTAFNLYLDTLFYLYKREPNFKPLFENANSYCIKHFALLHDQADKHLKGDEKEAFMKQLVHVYNTSMEKSFERIEWFVKKYDYRYKDEPWKDAKVAIPLALRQVASIKPKA